LRKPKTRSKEEIDAGLIFIAFLNELARSSVRLLGLLGLVKNWLRWSVTTRFSLYSSAPEVQT